MNLAELNSFTQAAAASHLSQPAFSALIQTLEGELGVRLFDRNTRHVELTCEGQEFHAGACRILAEIELALGMVRDRMALRRGRIALAVLPSIAAGWLPQVLANFHAEFPEISLQVFDLLSEDCVEHVRLGKADMAIAAMSVSTPQLRAEPFQTDDFFLVAREGHPVLAVQKPQPRDLISYDFVHLSRNSSVRQYIDAATFPLKMRTVLELDQLASVMGMVKAGLGITIVPALTLFHFQHPELVTRPLQWHGLKRAIHLIRRRDRELSVPAQVFYQRLLGHRQHNISSASPVAHKRKTNA